MPKREEEEEEDEEEEWRLCSSSRAPPLFPPFISGGVVLVVVQVIVEGDDGADELSQLHEVGRDDVDATLSRSLRPDPLHHAWQGSVGAGRRRTH